MKINAVFALIIIIGFFGFTACTVNVNTPANANTASATTVITPSPVATVDLQGVKARWSVVVCTSRAGTVNMSAGASESDSATFANWKEGTTEIIFHLPARLQNLSSIYVEANGSESNPVELCVLYDGRPKKRIAFDEGNESHIINSSDDDDNDCRCTE